MVLHYLVTYRILFAARRCFLPVCSLLQLAGAKSRTDAPDGTCTRLSVLRIASYGTAVLP